jgi:hypothetical protein
MGIALIDANEPGTICYAFLEPAEVLSESAHGSVAVVLASILAHEVGHLMGLPHSRSGVMKPALERTDIVKAESGRLLFSSSDAKSLRASRR